METVIDKPKEDRVAFGIQDADSKLSALEVCAAELAAMITRTKIKQVRCVRRTIVYGLPTPHE